MRAIGRWSLTALMINTIIGGGIFGLPSEVAGLVGKFSPLAVLIAGAGVGVIMACFAEVASQFREAGGAYLYTQVAFGRLIALQVAWLSWLVRIAAAAAVANVFVNYLAEFWPSSREPLLRALVLTLLVGFLAAVNYRGVSGGAQLSNFFTVAKLLPLLVFIATGLFHLVFRHGIPGTGSDSPAGFGKWFEAVLVLVFAYGGAEGALMATGEAKDPRRDVPFAVFVSLALVTLVYTLIQVVVIALLPNAAASSRPLAAAAQQFLGPAGANLMAAGALISTYGYLSAVILGAPRLTYALAERGDFPPLFAAVHRTFRTPYISIVVFALLSWGLALAGTFRWNAVLSVVARMFTFGLVCAALPVLRRKQPQAPAFRLAAGRVFAWLGIAFSAVLLTRMGRSEAVIIAVTAGVALLNWLWARRRETPTALGAG